MIFGDFLKALGQIADPRFRAVVWRGIGLALALLAAAWLLVFWGVAWLAPDRITLPLIGEVTWVERVLSTGSLLLMLVLSPVLMVPVASAFSGLFLDEVAQAVEDRHFPALPRARGQSLWQGAADSLRFLGLLVLANLGCLLLIPVAGPALPLIYWAMNGYLLGREYFQLVAARRLSPAEAAALRRAHPGQIWAAGILMAAPLSLPLVNLVVPVLAAASFTHLFHRLQALPRRPA